MCVPLKLCGSPTYMLNMATVWLFSAGTILNHHGVPDRFNADPFNGYLACVLARLDVWNISRQLGRVSGMIHVGFPWLGVRKSYATSASLKWFRRRRPHG